MVDDENDIGNGSSELPNINEDLQQLHSESMSEEEQDERRKMIKEIMKDKELSQQEKQKSINQLMDGRRRGSLSSSVGRRGSLCSRRGSLCGSVGTSTAGATSRRSSICSAYGEDDEFAAKGHSYVSSMSTLARAAHAYYSSDDEGDAIMTDVDDDGEEYINYGYGEAVGGDNGSLASCGSERAAQRQNSLSSFQIPDVPYKQIHGRSSSLPEWNDNERAINSVAACKGLGLENPAQISRLMELNRPECTHYERNCTIVAPCCGLAFGCRICHDECPVLPPPLNTVQQQNRNNNKKDEDMLVADMKKLSHHHQKAERRLSMPLDLEIEEDNHHKIDRFAIREVICRQCYHRQSSKTNHCVNCGIQFGKYHCSTCNLWMSDEEEPYHCTDCGFCRVGGKENFQHCHDCGMCIDKKLFQDHNCKAGKYMSNCPVCQEDLFSSRYASHEMPCGHAIHWHCFKELTSYDSRCPVCKKTAETPEEMESTWSAIAMGISLQPVPPDLTRVVNIVCNDCGIKDSNRRWHFLGVRCQSCLSFNTNVEQIVLQGSDAVEYLDQTETAEADRNGQNASG